MVKIASTKGHPLLLRQSLASRLKALLALGCAAGAAGALWWVVSSRDKAGAPDASTSAEPTRAASVGPSESRSMAEPDAGAGVGDDSALSVGARV